jgi:SAM-dependent methyltransferase
MPNPRSPAALDRARQDNPGVVYRLSNGNRLPWQQHQFDCALAVCVVHHVPPSEWTAFVAEMRRVVRPGGLLVLIEHNPWNPLTRLAVFRCPFDEDAVLLGARKARELLRGAGCSAIESRHFALLPSRRTAARRIEWLLQNAPLGAQYVACGTA